jgi:hypothetical protein|tara:strand:- start:1808 stop:2050 length:243 start_codon:yes stop_codon:yes gene_type:complete
MTPQARTKSLKQDELNAAGWKRRSMLTPDRMTEVELIYQNLGLETLVCDPEVEDFGPECETCQSRTCPEYRVIYTRKKKP